MPAIRIKGLITNNRQLIVELPTNIAPGTVEVTILHPSFAKKIRKRARRKVVHPAFGLWTNRTDINGSQKLAMELRRNLEKRADNK
jgi:hypothetical protein